MSEPLIALVFIILAVLIGHWLQRREDRRFQLPPRIECRPYQLDDQFVHRYGAGEGPEVFIGLRGKF